MASFTVVFDRIAPATNKYMAVLWNGSADRKVVLNRVYRFNWQTGAQTGVLLEQELREITARTAGTALTIVADDITDTLTAGILAEHGGGATDGGRGLLRRFYATNEEMALAAASVVQKDTALLHDAQMVYWRRPGSTGWTIPAGRGIAIKNTTASTVGTCSYVIEFDDNAP